MFSMVGFSVVLFGVLLFGRLVYSDGVIVGKLLVVGVFVLVLMRLVSGCYSVWKLFKMCMLVFVFIVV